MNVVVFGGSGFLGSHVASALTNAGYKVTIFDLQPSKYLEKDQKMVVGSVLDANSVMKVVKDAEVVYNFAGIADIQEAKEKPVETIKINTLGNTIILEACRQCKVKRYIFASTMYVYNLLGSFYRSSKQAAELIIHNYHAEYGIPYTILRYGSLYGPRAGEWNGIYRLLNQAITEEKIVFQGTGNELREFIHVQDAARYSVEILADEYENQCLILTGTEKMKYRDLIQMINEMLGNTLKIEFKKVEKRDHYEITPYSFEPKMAKKYVSTTFYDLGQGILQCLMEIYENHPQYKKLDELLMHVDGEG